MLRIIGDERERHAEATRALHIHKVAVGSLNKTLQLVLLGLFFSSRITEIVHLNGVIFGCKRSPATKGRTIFQYSRNEDYSRQYVCVVWEVGSRKNDLPVLKTTFSKALPVASS